MSAKYNAFGLSGLRKNWSIIPLVAIIGAGVGGAVSYVGYMLLTKQDYSFRPWKPLSAGYTTNPYEVRKLYVPHKPHVDVDPEIEALKKEIYAEYHK